MLVLHYDFTSPASAVAVLRLQALADEGAAVAFSGLDELGLAAPVPPTLDQLEGLDRWRRAAEERGLVLRRPSRRPPTLGAHLLAEAADAADLGAAWRRAVLESYWSRDVDLGDDAALVAVARDVGLDPAEAAARLADRPARAALRRRMAADRGRGVGGVPVVEAGGTLVAADLAEDDLRALATL